MESVVQGGVSLVSQLYSLGTTIHNNIHDQQVISQLYGYLFVDQNRDGYFELGLKVGIIVGTRGRKEDKFADELKIAKLLDVRHFVQQLVASKVTEMVQECLKAISAELMYTKVRYPGISSNGTTISEINDILTKGVLRPLCLVFNATNSNPHIDQHYTNAQGQVIPIGPPKAGDTGFSSADIAAAFGSVSVGSSAPGSIPHGLPRRSASPSSGPPGGSHPGPPPRAPANSAPGPATLEPTAPTGNAPTGNAPTGNAPTGNVPTGNAPTGNAPTGNAPAGNAPTGNAPTDNTPTGNAPDGAAPLGPDPGHVFDINKPQTCPGYCLLKRSPPEHGYVPRPHTIQFYHPDQLRAFNLSNTCIF
eukprot:Phypoly_transcript_10830.p1 GENE.Phypoly_transcript_10830~~Phypoly_transcript_10830.p1  ORF type:complete len:361 (+),score=51.20 Phypoly_transcript_10830:139-1221(+)